MERYNATLIAEWLRRRPYDSEADRTEALATFLNYYNHKRGHSAIGWVPPISRTPARGALVEVQDQLVDVTPEQLATFDL